MKIKGLTEADIDRIRSYINDPNNMEEIRRNMGCAEWLIDKILELLPAHLVADDETDEIFVIENIPDQSTNARGFGIGYLLSLALGREIIVWAKGMSRPRPVIARAVAQS